MEKIEYYPRPQLKRNSYYSLSGLWDYKIKNIETDEIIKEGKILVPYAPEAKKSGVDYILQPNETIIYEKDVHFNESFEKETESLILHFTAVDYNAALFIDGEHKLSHHGGYSPFSITLDKPSFHITLVATDPTDTKDIARGKQKLKPKGIWYTSTSGIYQDVWIEKVKKEYIEKIRIIPSLTGFNLLVKANTGEKKNVKVSFLTKEYEIKTNQFYNFEIENPHLWSPEDPFLYFFTLSMGEDEVESYVGLRKFSIEEDEKDIKRIFLNGKPYFNHGILDQGYYKDGLYTPLSLDEMISDLIRVKEMGFNTIRKHIKVEPLFWYYLCDKLGLLVWQDMVSGGASYNKLVISAPLFLSSFLSDKHYSLFSRKDKNEREIWKEEAFEMVENLFNTVSLCMWVPFNEGWGQFDSVSFSEELTKLDPTRLVDHASGWHDQKYGLFKSIHVYFKKYKFKKDKLNRAVIISEFGGYGLAGKKYQTTKNIFVYKKFKSEEKLTEAICTLYKKEIIKAKEEGLAASIYTQLSDVEEELNGLISYDRKFVKVKIDKIQEISRELLT